MNVKSIHICNTSVLSMMKIISLQRGVAVRHSEEVDLLVSCEVCSIDWRVIINQGQSLLLRVVKLM